MERGMVYPDTSGAAETFPGEPESPAPLSLDELEDILSRDGWFDAEDA